MRFHRTPLQGGQDEALIEENENQERESTTGAFPQSVQTPKPSAVGIQGEPRSSLSNGELSATRFISGSSNCGREANNAESVARDVARPSVAIAD
jgi:hypothetical protein